MNQTRRTLLGAFALTPLAGCGFHLRNSFTLPFESIFLEMPKSNALTLSVKRQLKAASNIRIVDSAMEAEAVLKLLENSSSRKTTAYNSAGRAREYELIQVVRFKLTGPKGEEYLPETTLRAMRSITYDDSKYLSYDSEDAMIRNEMLTDLASQVIRRLERAKKPEPQTK